MTPVLPIDLLGGNGNTADVLEGRFALIYGWRAKTAKYILSNTR